MKDALWWEEAKQYRSQSDRLAPAAIVVTTSLPFDNKAGEIILRKFLSLLSSVYNDVWVITTGGSKEFQDSPQWLHIRDTSSGVRKQKNFLKKILGHLISQYDLCHELKVLDLNRATIFFWNAGILILPHLYLCYRKASTLFFRFGDSSVAPRIKYPGMKGRILSTIIGSIENFNLFLANHIAIENMSMLQTNPMLCKYYKKITEISLYVNIDRFSNRIPLAERKIDVLYLGRLAPEKGTLQLIAALKMLKMSGKKIKVAITGSGPLENIVKWETRNLECVTLNKWIPYSDVPDFLQNSKLLVIPSDTEGLPNVLIEGMASGTIPVATSVGGIPGLVVPEETGFILRDNAPGTIADVVEKVLKHSELQKISQKASELIHNNYSYSATHKRLRHSLKKLGLIE